MSAECSNSQGGASDIPDFEDLVNRFYAPLYRFAMSLTQSESDAGDLVQEVFVTWAEKGSQLRDRTKVRSWLFTTLHRAFLESRRRITRFPQVEIEEAALEDFSVEPDMVSRLDGQSLVNLLSRIDPQFRSAVTLFYLEDYSYAEIGNILEIPIGTVKSRISRGIAQLKSLIGQSSPRAGLAQEECS